MFCWKNIEGDMYYLSSFLYLLGEKNKRRRGCKSFFSWRIVLISKKFCDGFIFGVLKGDLWVIFCVIVYKSF